jgi:hypothetical protein
MLEVRKLGRADALWPLSPINNKCIHGGFGSLTGTGVGTQGCGKT